MKGTRKGFRNLHKMSKSLSLASAVLFLSYISSYSQSYETINLDLSTTYQTIVGFGGSLAYYEGWVTAHPNKDQIYEALFGELSLDILRLRNAYDYDPGMIDRASEFVHAAEDVRGKPISILTTSWSPPAYLKSNNDRNNGGTLKYTLTDGKVEFDYAGFAHWWNSALNEYNTNGVYPDYIGIQNEPDFTASYESCRLNPTETINISDTIAGFDRALDAVYDSIQGRSQVPKILGPETIGIGYNAVQNYCNRMDLTKIIGIAHHLYHGSGDTDPYASNEYKKVGDYRPEIPHFQTEFSRHGWWELGGYLYMSLCVENVVAYLYWDLAWDGGGLISLDFPWSPSSWEDPTKGYTRTKEFYAFKQYSAFIHPGWKRIDASVSDENAVISAFINPSEDSAALVVINRSESEDLISYLDIPGYSIDTADLYVTSESENCEYIGNIKDELLMLSPRTIATVAMSLSRIDNPVPVDSISLSPTSDTIGVRLGSLKIIAEVYPSDASNKTIFWEIIENSHIAGITQDGLLEAKGTDDGKVRIRVSATDGSRVFADTMITVINQVLVESISISSSGIKIDEPEGSIQFTANVLPEEAFNKELQWEIISGSSIASLSPDGVLQANGTGDGTVTMRISATDGSGVYKEVSIRISNQIAVTEVVISAADTVINTLMGSLQLEALILPENASDKNVVWSLEKGHSLATVNQEGQLTASGEENGTVMVRVASVSFPEIFDEISISVQNQVTSSRMVQPEELRIWYAAGKIRFEVPASNKTGELSVYTIEGKLMKTIKIDRWVTRGEIDIHELERGIYLIRLDSPAGHYYEKVQVYY